MRLAFQPHYWVICLYPLLSCSEKPVLSWHVKKMENRTTLYDTLQQRVFGVHPPGFVLKKARGMSNDTLQPRVFGVHPPGFVLKKARGMSEICCSC